MVLSIIFRWSFVRYCSPEIMLCYKYSFWFECFSSMCCWYTWRRVDNFWPTANAALVQTSGLYSINPFLTSCKACTTMVTSWLVMFLFCSHHLLFSWICALCFRISIRIVCLYKIMLYGAVRSYSPTSQTLSAGRISGSKLLTRKLDVLIILLSVLKSLFRYFANLSSFL
jgi:hypothetical protein